MSHFTVLVTGGHQKALQPSHEFECTGTNDAFVATIDQTEEVRAEHADHVKDGGKYPLFRDYVAGYHGAALVENGEQPDTDGEHKFSFATLDETGEVTGVFRRTNPNSKWDWWEVGGRWRGKLLTKLGKRVDQALAGDIDWAGMIASTSKDAGAIFDEVHAVVGTREVVSWEQTLKRRDAGEFDIEGARAFYNSQECVKELIRREVIDAWSGADTLSKVLAATDRDSYVELEGETNATTFAMLHDGKWYERGRMGWFGMSSDTPESTADYTTQFWAIARALPPDTPVAVVDCHI